jgi:hypothetical protein
MPQKVKKVIPNSKIQSAEVGKKQSKGRPILILRTF